MYWRVVTHVTVAWRPCTGPHCPDAASCFHQQVFLARVSCLCVSCHVGLATCVLPCVLLLCVSCHVHSCYVTFATCNAGVTSCGGMQHCQMGRGRSQLQLTANMSQTTQAVRWKRQKTCSVSCLTLLLMMQLLTQMYSRTRRNIKPNRHARA